ncbi:MAG: dimethyladenosine transferase [Frankiales bacterium]|nr:dimethyladenosine transferase [Frankiales bacterium]
MTTSTRSVSRTTVVASSPSAVFDLLADPRRHADVDGSGTVKGRLRGPARLSRGARFGMRMRLVVPYAITNTVVEFEEGRRIAWRHLGRHVWRWELAAVPEGTRVTETFDWGPSLAPWALERLGVPARNARSIEATLARLPGALGAA